MSNIDSIVEVETAAQLEGIVQDEQVSKAMARTPKGRRALNRARNLAHRGMVTAEYAVGILAAVAIALVLVRVFNDNSFFAELLKQVTRLIGQLGASIK